jgi:hypothetical protein
MAPLIHFDIVGIGFLRSAFAEMTAVAPRSFRVGAQGVVVGGLVSDERAKIDV